MANIYSNKWTVSVQAGVTQYDLRVLVKNTAGAPISGATVTVAGKQTQTTSSLGFIDFYLPAGTYTVTASASGYQTASQTVNLQGNYSLTVQLQPTEATLYDLHIQVVTIPINKIEYNIPGATVSVDGQTKTTNIDGYVDFYLPAGTYTVTASAIGYKPSSQTVNLQGNSSLTFKLQSTGAQPYDLRVLVENTAGKPIAGARIYAPGAIGFLPGQWTLTNSDGYADLQFYPGNYVITASAYGYETTHKSIAIEGNTSLTIQLQPISTTTSCTYNIAVWSGISGVVSPTTATITPSQRTATFTVKPPDDCAFNGWMLKIGETTYDFFSSSNPLTLTYDELNMYEFCSGTNTYQVLLVPKIWCPIIHPYPIQKR